VFDLDTAIAELLPALNERPFQRLPGSRASTFAEIDRPALQPLPSSRYEMARFKRARVHIDYHVQVEGHFYSVPHAGILGVGPTQQPDLAHASFQR